MSDSSQDPVVIETSQRSTASRAVVAVLLAAVLPWLLTWGARELWGIQRHVNEPVHESLELMGACIALGVAMLLWMRMRHEEGSPPHHLWVALGLVVMGIVDGAHAVLPFGIAWSWLHHGATLLGGLTFSLVWLPARMGFIRRRQVLLVAFTALALGICLTICFWPNLLPLPLQPAGYTFPPKLVNGVGGLGFVLAAVFFLRRYLRHAETQDLVFASQALLFGNAGVLFSISHLWGAGWWAWHVFRLLADGTLLAVAFELINTDITQRKRTEKALQAERKKLTTILDVLPAYVVLLSPDYHVPLANRFFVERFGESHGRRCYEYLFGLSEPCEICESFKALKTSAPHHWEWKGPDGRDYDIFDTPFVDADGTTMILEMGLDMTERKRAEEALSESEARYRSLVLATSQVVWMTDADGQVVTDMPMWRAFTGMTIEQIRGWGWINSLHPDDRERTAEVWHRAVETRSSYDTEYRMRRHDGEYRYVSVRGAPVLGPDGEVCEWVGTCTDITERMLAQYAMRHLAAIVESTDDAIVAKTLDGVITTWNTAAEGLYGYTAAEAIGQSMELVVPPELHEEFRSFLARVGRGENVAHHETIRVRRDGARINVSVTLSPIRDGAGAITGVSAIVRDITANKKVEEDLRKASLYSRSLIEASLDPLVTISRDGRITDVNRSAELVTGVSRDQLIGSDFSDYFTNPQKAREGYQQVFAEGSVRDYPLAVLHTSGHITDVLYNATVFRNQAGEIEGVFAAARDVTDRKRAEEELARRVQELARSNAELEQFAYIASHDLQEPLRMVASYTQLLASRYRTHLDATADKYIDYAVEGAQRMQALINDLLALSRVTTRGVPSGPVDLNQVVREVCGMLAATIRETNARVESENLPIVMADATQMHQLLQNLIGNALKFHGDQPPLVCIRGARNDRQWTIAVEDNGIGIDPQYSDRIFVAFQRLHTRTEYPGNGIGLAICKKIAERHGGRIWVESTPGHGSKFIFALPVGQVTDIPKEVDEPAVMAEA